MDVWEWMGNFTPHFTGYVIAYPCWYSSYSVLVEKMPNWMLHNLNVAVLGCIQWVSWCVYFKWVRQNLKSDTRQVIYHSRGVYTWSSRVAGVYFEWTRQNFESTVRQFKCRSCGVYPLSKQLMGVYFEWVRQKWKSNSRQYICHSLRCILGVSSWVCIFWMSQTKLQIRQAVCRSWVAYTWSRQLWVHILNGSDKILN